MRVFQTSQQNTKQLGEHKHSQTPKCTFGVYAFGVSSLSKSLDREGKRPEKLPYLSSYSILKEVLT